MCGDDSALSVEGRERVGLFILLWFYLKSSIGTVRFAPNVGEIQKRICLSYCIMLGCLNWLL